MKKSPSPSSSPRKTSLSELKAAKRAAMKGGEASSSSSASSLAYKDPFESAVKCLESGSAPRLPTGVYYDARMLLHANPWDAGHIESPERLRLAYERCAEYGLWQRCLQLPGRLADDHELLLAHTPEHLDRLKATADASADADELRRTFLSKYHSAFANAHSLEASRLAVAGVVDCSQAVLDGRVQNAMALVRPPGHHALREEFCGFCLVNNVAIAAKKALDGGQAKRVLIVDFDVHHGQATQQAFFADPRVLYVSIHRYEYGKFWPHLRESDYDVVGRDAGAGHNVNIPLNATGMQDQDYLALFHRLVLPLAYDFDPDLVLVSAGLDAALGCPEGEMRLSPAVYGHFVSSLMSLASGRLVLAMEGGYFIESLAESTAMCLRALLGDDPLPLGPMPGPCDSLADTILNVLSVLHSYWKLLDVHDTYSISEYDAAVDKDCHEPIILYQGTTEEAVSSSSSSEVRDLNDIEYTPGNHYFKHPPEQAERFMQELASLTQRHAHLLNNDERRSKRVALVYDAAMMRHANLEEPNHPEKPSRVERIFQLHQESGLLERDGLLRVESRRATQEEVCLVHDNKYFDSMIELSKLDPSELEEAADKFDSIYMNTDSFDCALLSCGSLLNVVDAVCTGDAAKGVAIVRPPGHHAEAEDACGFCFFNNVAVAARYAIDMHCLKRVLILDWDVHHGNGTQNMFYEDPRVLYVSLHRFDGGIFFPTRPDGNHDYVGSGPGAGFNVNVPWNGPGMGDAEYLLAFLNVVMPVAYEFDPELVLVSAGFDAARGDPLGHCKVSPEMYGHMTHHLQSLANGKVIVALEGGYNLNSLSLSMTMCTKALLGDPMPPLQLAGVVPKPSAVQSIQDVARSHAPYWSSLRVGLARLPDSFDDLKAQMLSSKPVRAVAQAVADAVALSPGRVPPHAIPGAVADAVASAVASTPLGRPVAVSSISAAVSEAVATVAASYPDADTVEHSSAPPTPAVSDSRYIPSEYGNCAESFVINTISRSALSSDGGRQTGGKKPSVGTVDSDYRRKNSDETVPGVAGDGLAAQMSRMSVTSAFSQNQPSTPTRGQQSEYIPNEYGQNFSSPYVNTVSKTWSKAHYQMTDAPKQQDRDRGTKTEEAEEK